jgi:hypothetical protein
MSDLWRFRGTPHYLEQQGRRLKIDPLVRDRARRNQEIYRLSCILAQLSERYHKARKGDALPVFGKIEKDQIRGALGQAELDLQRLHLLAATSEMMLAEAYEAFELPVPRRNFELLDNDPGPRILPLGDGTVGVPDAALAGAL